MIDGSRWRQLLEVYFAVKKIYATCEEVDEELKTNLQPLNEFRAALDHIMRVIAVEDPEIIDKAISEKLPFDFKEQNLHSATSHLYEASPGCVGR